MRFTPARVGACLGICLPLSAFANVAFTTLERSSYGGPGAPGQVSAKTLAEFQAAGLDQLAPNAQIDWDHEMVLAVFMGAKNTGGYSISIERIELNPLPPPPAGAPASPQHFMDVYVRRTSPGPGSIVTQAITHPYHVIKTAKDVMAVVRFHDVGAGPALGALPFDTLMQSQGIGPSAPRMAAIRNFTELNDFLQPHGAPLGMHVDFAQRMVIGVALGDSSWGTQVEITEVERSLLHPAPLGVTPQPTETVVKYRVTAPSGPVIALAAAPVHLITLDRLPANEPIRFVNLSGPGFHSLTRQRSYLNQNTTLRVDPSGRVDYAETGTSSPTIVSDALTAAELQALQQALASAQVDQLPGDLSPNQSPPFVPDITTYTLVDDAGSHSAHGWTGLFHPQYAARLAPLDAALDAVVQRITAPAPSASWDSATLTTHYPLSPSSQWPVNRDVVVEPSGRVRVLKSHPTAHFAPIEGQATQAELDQLGDAIRQASLSTIPSPLPVLIPMHLPSNPFTLRVRSSDPQNDATIDGEYDIYAQWDAQLRPLIELLDAIGRRVELQAFPPSQVSGVVTLQPGGTLALQDGHDSYELSNAASEQISRDLRKFEGRRVTVSGQVSVAPGTPGSPLLVSVDADAIANPVRQQLSAVVYADAAQRPVLMLGSPFQASSLQRIEAFGRAERVLEAAIDRQIEADGWLFRDELGRPTGAWLESIRGTARHYSPLTISGHLHGYVRKGDDVLIQRLSSSGRYARVDGPHGNGYLRVNRLKVGLPLPAIQPLTSGPGLSAAVAATGAGN